MRFHLCVAILLNDFFFFGNFILFIDILCVIIVHDCFDSNNSVYDGGGV